MAVKTEKAVERAEKEAESVKAELIDKTEGKHTVYFAECKVEFVDGVAAVSAAVAKALKDAGLVK